MLSAFSYLHSNEMMVTFLLKSLSEANLGRRLVFRFEDYSAQA